MKMMPEERVIMFSLHEKVVYPGHGVARINNIVTKHVAGHETRFYELKFLNKDMTVLVPMHNLSSVGIRQLTSRTTIDAIFKKLAEPAPKSVIDVTAVNWNKRNKRYQEDIRQGSLEAISRIYRDLRWMAQFKELSFGEKVLLQQTEAMIAQEISLVQNVDESKAVEELRAVVGASAKRGSVHNTVAQL